MGVEFEKRGHVALITLNRPEARNAINGEMAQGIEDALDRFEEDTELWCGVLTANGPAFCAGADLKEISAGNGGKLGTARGGFAGIVQRERTKPLIAAVPATAVAGGCEISLACDMIVAAEDSIFGLPEVKRALVAIAGALIRLPRAVGMATAMEMVLTGEPIPARRAYELGMINRIVPKEQVLDEALSMAEKIAGNAPLAVQISRNLAARAFTADEADLWREGIEQFLENMGTEDAKEGPLAFIEKRAPNWKAK